MMFVDGGLGLGGIANRNVALLVNGTGGSFMIFGKHEPNLNGWDSNQKLPSSNRVLGKVTSPVSLHFFPSLS